MDNLDIKNIQLAYTAVYDQELCESMEDLGFFGDLQEDYDIEEYYDIDEGYKKLPVGKMMKQAARKPVKAAQKYEDLNFGYGSPRKMNTIAGEPNWLIRRALRQANKMARVASRHSTIKGKGKVRGEGQAELNRRRGEMKEDYEYDLYDLILEYLLDEGYTDSLEGAEAIMANMSEEWIEDIVEEREPGVKPYRPGPTQRQIRRQAGRAERKARGRTADQPGYGPEEKFYKPEDKRIPDKETAEWFRKTKKTFGRPTGKYNPGTIKLGDIISQFPENRPGGQPKPRRVLPSRFDKK